MAYRKVETHTWNDERFRALSRDARALWLYILTSPHSNRFGYYVLDPLYAASDLQLDPDAVAVALGEVEAAGMVRYDPVTRMVLVLRHFKHNPPQNPNVVKGSLKELERVPYSVSLNPHFLEVMRRYLPEETEKGKPFCRPWIEWARAQEAKRHKGSNPSPNPSRNPSPNESPNLPPIQEQEQEQEVLPSLRSGAEPESEPEKSWSAEACDVWKAVTGGTPPGGRIGTALKTLVEEHGREAVLANFRAYLRQHRDESRLEFANPQDFASRYGYWAESGGQGEKRQFTDESRVMSAEEVRRAYG